MSCGLVIVWIAVYLIIREVVACFVSCSWICCILDFVWWASFEGTRDWRHTLMMMYICCMTCLMDTWSHFRAHSRNIAAKHDTEIWESDPWPCRKSPRGSSPREMIDGPKLVEKLKQDKIVLSSRLTKTSVIKLENINPGNARKWINSLVSWMSQRATQRLGQLFSLI